MSSNIKIDEGEINTLIEYSPEEIIEIYNKENGLKELKQLIAGLGIIYFHLITPPGAKIDFFLVYDM